MDEKMAKMIFDIHNPASDVVRCPYGKSGIRTQLDSYARAAVNLYGIIELDEFIDIYNSQNPEQVGSGDVYILLLPLVLKKGWYCFYKEYLVHYVFFDDLVLTKYLLEEQRDKPRYIPGKDKFLQYIDEDFTDNQYWENVRLFMYDIFGPGVNTYLSYEEIKEFMIYGRGINKLGHILDKYNLVFDSEKQFERLLNLLMEGKNNTPIWENNGFTPNELIKTARKEERNLYQLPKLENRKIGRNESCPCGSGKKYKKCCLRYNELGSAQLSPEECRLFYEIWFGLMSFVNEEKKVINDIVKPIYPNPINDIKIHKIREVLWENPDLIQEYIQKTELPDEKVEVLNLWRTNYIKDSFFIIEYQREYAVLIGTNDKGENRLYGVKGISNSIANALLKNLPVQIETILLPFKGKIIYDSFLSSLPISFGEGAKNALGAMKEEAEKHGIITNLD